MISHLKSFLCFAEITSKAKRRPDERRHTMAGLNAVVGRVGAGLNQVQFQSARQTQAVKERRPVGQDLGSAALKLVNSTLTYSRELAHDLDVRA